MYLVNFYRLADRVDIFTKKIIPHRRSDHRHLGNIIIVLLSDGMSNTGPLPLDAAAQAADRGGRVYTVGVGSAAGGIMRSEAYSMRVRLDEETLRRIADKTDGTYFKAESETELGNIYKDLGTSLVFEEEKTELTAGFTGLAVVLALIAGMLSMIWLRRLR